MLFREEGVSRDERGEDDDGKEMSEIPGGWERVEIVCPFVCS